MFFYRLGAWGRAAGLVRAGVAPEAWSAGLETNKCRSIAPCLQRERERALLGTSHNQNDTGLIYYKQDRSLPGVLLETFLARLFLLETFLARRL